MGRRLAVLAVVGTAAGALLVALPSTGTIDRPARPPADFFALDDTAIPDDTVLMAQLERAVDLRRRENFDRMLDAREPGELVEHATLTEGRFDGAPIAIDTLFVVGSSTAPISGTRRTCWASDRSPCWRRR